jgi:hypothetical protein
VVDVIRYRDKLGHDRRCYRLIRPGVFIGEYKTPEELSKVVDLGTLVEDDSGETVEPPGEITQEVRLSSKAGSCAGSIDIELGFALAAVRRDLR